MTATMESIRKIMDAESKAIEQARRQTAAHLKSVAKKMDFKGEEARLLAQLEQLYGLAAEMAEFVPGFRFRPRHALGARPKRVAAPSRGTGKRSSSRGVRDGSLVSHLLSVLGDAKQPVEKNDLWEAVKKRGYKSGTKNPMNSLGVALSLLKQDGRIASFKKGEDGTFTRNQGSERGSFYGLA